LRSVLDSLPVLSRPAKRAVGVGARVLSALGLLVVFAVAAGGGAVLHLDTHAGRRVLVKALARLLSDTLEGEFSFGAVEDVGTRRVVVSDVEIKDPFGNVVIRAAQLTANSDLPSLVQDALFGTGNLNIVIDRVRLDGVETFLVEDPQTRAPTLATTFLPVEHPEPASGAPSAPSAARAVRVWLPDIQIGQVYARGVVGGLPTLESTVRNVKASVLVSPKGVVVDVQRFGVVARGLGGVDARGTGTVRVNAPGSVWTTFDGWFGEVPVGALVEVKQGGELVVTADLPSVKPEAVKVFLPSYPVRHEARAHATLRGKGSRFAVEADVGVGLLSRLEVKGELVTTQGVEADVDVAFRSLDLRAVEGGGGRVW
jgi:translocation and assembly module TamB